MQGRIVAVSRGVLVGVIAALSSASAFAADLPNRAPVYTKAPPAVYGWDGWYIGVHAGYASGDTNLVTLNSGFEALRPRGMIGGLQTGYLRHLSRDWVLGFEADFSTGDFDAPGRQQIDYFGTARSRLGYAQGPWLFYGTGGVAWAMSAVAPVAGGLDGHRMPHVGWTAGVGVEYALNAAWSVRAEYLYVDLDNVLVTRGNVNVTEDMTFNVFRVALNYRFGEVRDTQVRALGYADDRQWSLRAPTWTGIYIGAHGGYAFGQERLQPFAGPVARPDIDGAFGGIQSGANWQFARNWLIGIEADSSWGSINGTGPFGAVTKIDTLGTVRGRLGYVMNNWMLYTTAGGAWAHTKAFVPGDTSYDRFLLGWTAGAGVEYLLNERWSLKAEYLYTEFAQNHVQVMTNTETQDTKIQTIKVGINYRSSLLGLLLDR